MDKNKQHCFGNLMLFNIFNEKNQFFSYLKDFGGIYLSIYKNIFKPIIKHKNILFLNLLSLETSLLN
jgi:hypothetical protein